MEYMSLPRQILWTALSTSGSSSIIRSATVRWCQIPHSVLYAGSRCARRADRIVLSNCPGSLAIYRLYQIGGQQSSKNSKTGNDTLCQLVAYDERFCISDDKQRRILRCCGGRLAEIVDASVVWYIKCGAPLTRAVSGSSCILFFLSNWLFSAFAHTHATLIYD